MPATTQWGQKWFLKLYRFRIFSTTPYFQQLPQEQLQSSWYLRVFYLSGIDFELPHSVPSLASYHRWKKMLLNSFNKKSSQNISVLTNDWCWDYENYLVKCGRSVAKNCKFKFFWSHCIMVCCASFLACHVSLGHLLLTAFEWDEAATRIMAELSLVRKSIRKLLVFVSVYYFECSTNFNYLFPIHDLNFQSF